MTKSKLGLAMVAVLLSCAACSAEAGGGAPTEESTSAAQELVLQEFQAGDEQVTFSEITEPDGSKAIALRETLPAQAKESLADRARAAAGRPLTTLELFQALAPAGAKADAALVTAHAKEARAMGRVDAAVLNVSMDRLAPIEKSVAACEAWVYDVTGQLPGYGYTLRGTKTNVSGDQFACLNNDCGYYTEGFIRTGTCNESNVSITEQTAWGYKSVNNGAWQTVKSTLAAFQITRREIAFTSGNPKRAAAEGYSPAGKLYHLRSGVLTFTHP
jgi:hypothetical protein